MTRINVGYPVERLTRQHLLAEHREIKRIPNVVASGRAVMKNIPDKFTLGKGHVKFFYNKLEYLLERYCTVRNECYRRGYNVQDYSGCWNDIPKHLMNNYVPTDEDKALIIDRINERIGTGNGV